VGHGSIRKRWDTLILDGNGNDTCLVLDDHGNPHITYYDVSNERLKYAKWSGNEWVIEEVTADNKRPYGYQTLVLDRNASPHICYYDTMDERINYVHRRDNLWKFGVLPETEASNLHPRIAIDSINKIMICFYDFEVEELRMATKAGDNWSVETIDKVGCGEGYCGMSVVMDRSNRPHIAYFEGDKQDLKYAYPLDGGWHIETVDNKTDVWFNISLVLDSKGMPHISYYDNANVCKNG